MPASKQTRDRRYREARQRHRDPSAHDRRVSAHDVPALLGRGPHRGPRARPEERARADAQLSTSGQANRRRLPEYQRRSSSMAEAKVYRGLQPSSARIFSIDMRLRVVTIPMAAWVSKGRLVELLRRAPASHAMAIARAAGRGTDRRTGPFPAIDATASKYSRKEIDSPSPTM